MKSRIDIFVSEGNLKDIWNYRNNHLDKCKNDSQAVGRILNEFFKIENENIEREKRFIKALEVKDNRIRNLEFELRAKGINNEILNQ